MWEKGLRLAALLGSTFYGSTVLRSGFASAGTTTSSSSTTAYPLCTGTASFISDGDCDSSNNNAACGFDGGDCCACTCVDDRFTCSSNTFDECVDPDADCDDDYYSGYISEDDTSSTEYTDDSVCSPDDSADGNCDYENDNEACGYDGGDCCACTCVDNQYTCSFNAFDSCVDPSADCDDDYHYGSTSEDYTSTTEYSDYFYCRPSSSSDGYCDNSNNNEACGYDGGDCCECTCVDGDLFTCSFNSFDDCVDPDADCSDGESSWEDSTLIVVSICVGSLIVVATIIIGVIICVCRCRQTRETGGPNKTHATLHAVDTTVVAVALGPVAEPSCPPPPYAP